MTTTIPLLQPVPLFKNADYRQALIREMDGGKIPLSLGKSCPVQCEFCYEIYHSYRETNRFPLSRQQEWRDMLEYIKLKPTDPLEF